MSSKQSGVIGAVNRQYCRRCLRRVFVVVVGGDLHIMAPFYKQLVGKQRAESHHRQHKNTRSVLLRVRQVASRLQRLDDPERAAGCLMEAVAHISEPHLSQRLQMVLKGMRKKGYSSFSNCELEMAQAAYRALYQTRTEKSVTDALQHAPKNLEPLIEIGSSRDQNHDSFNADVSATSTTVQTESSPFRPKATGALVSDSEDSLAKLSPGVSGVAPSLEECWGHLIEAVQLHTTACLGARLGNLKKAASYRLFRLSGSALPATQDPHRLAKQLTQEFLSLYYGVPCDRASHRRRKAGLEWTQWGDCRVYVACQDKTIWVQFYVGQQRWMRGKSSSTPPTMECTATIPLESNHLAVAWNHPRNSSNLLVSVLAALDRVMTSNATLDQLSKGQYLDGILELSGTDPLQLLRDARALDQKRVVGRYSIYDSAGKWTDPLTELRWASSKASGAARKRTAAEAFGMGGECPVRTRVQWHWRGETSAASSAWHDTRESDEKPSDSTQSMECKIVLQGDDVYSGIRALVAAGIMKAPLPHYIRDAPSMGATIIVDHGSVRHPSEKSHQGRG